MKYIRLQSKIESINVKVIFKIVSVRFKREFTAKIVHWDRRECPFYRDISIIVWEVARVESDPDPPK